MRPLSAINSAGSGPFRPLPWTARRAEARVIMEQYFDAMAQLGFSRQQAAELLREEES